KIGLIPVAFLGVLSAAWLLRDFRTTTADVSGDGCLVLAYHRVKPRPPLLLDMMAGQDEFTVYTDDFGKQMRTLKGSGATFIRPEELENIVRRRTQPPQKCTLITLDDADISQYEYAFPILKNEQIPFLLFVISGQVGAQDFNGMQMATWSQIREMTASKLATVGSHTHNMHQLSTSRQPVFMNPTAPDFPEDLKMSIATIGRELNLTVQYFAYPYGFGTPRTDEIALRSGMH